MTKDELLQSNIDFSAKLLKIVDDRSAQSAIAIALNEHREIIILSHPNITRRDLLQILREAANSVAAQTGGIIVPIS